MISTIDKPQGAFMCCLPALAVLVDSGFFHGLLLTILGSQSYFHDLERFPSLTIPGVHLCVGHQHSQFWLTLPRFMVYYSLFWGPGAISIIDAPRGAFTCRSPAIVILFDSGLFRGLLLTILGSQSYVHIHNYRGAFTCSSSCVYVFVVKHSQFWPILTRSWTITHRFGVPK